MSLKPSTIILAVLFGGALWGGFWIWNEVNHGRTGGGGRDVRTASGLRLTAHYGIQGQRRLGFLVLARYPKGSHSSHSSSRWVGGSKGPDGHEVSFEATLSEIVLNGETFHFDDGRVFIVHADGSRKTRQLSLEIGTGEYEEEVARLVKSPEIDEAFAD